MMPSFVLKQIATKAGIQHPAQELHFWTLVDLNPTQRGLASKPWIQDQPETSHFSKLPWIATWKFVFHCASEHFKPKKCSHQNSNPIFSWKSSFLTSFVPTRTNRFDGAALPRRLRTHKVFPFETCVSPCFSPFVNGGGTLQASHLERLPQTWKIYFADKGMKKFVLPCMLLFDGGGGPPYQLHTQRERARRPPMRLDLKKPFI